MQDRCDPKRRYGARLWSKTQPQHVRKPSGLEFIRTCPLWRSCCDWPFRHSRAPFDDSTVSLERTLAGTGFCHCLKSKVLAAAGEVSISMCLHHQVKLMSGGVPIQLSISFGKRKFSTWLSPKNMFSYRLPLELCETVRLSVEARLAC